MFSMRNLLTVYTENVILLTKYIVTLKHGLQEGQRVARHISNM